MKCYFRLIVGNKHFVCEKAIVQSIVSALKMLTNTYNTLVVINVKYCFMTKSLNSTHFLLRVFYTKLKKPNFFPQGAHNNNNYFSSNLAAGDVNMPGPATSV